VYLAVLESNLSWCAIRRSEISGAQSKIEAESNTLNDLAKTLILFS
jgi:hypothetical protein